MHTRHRRKFFTAQQQTRRTARRTVSVSLCEKRLNYGVKNKPGSVAIGAGHESLVSRDAIESGATADRHVIDPPVDHDIAPEMTAEIKQSCDHDTSGLRLEKNREGKCEEIAHIDEKAADPIPERTAAPRVIFTLQRRDPLEVPGSHQGFPANKTPSSHRIALTRMGVQHADALYRYQRDARLANIVGITPLRSVHHAQEWIRDENAKQNYPLAILHQHHGLVGTLVLEAVAPLPSTLGDTPLTVADTIQPAFFYYWIAETHRNHGYATAALELLHRFANDLGITHVFATVDSRNLASQRVVKKAGYQTMPFEFNTSVNRGMVLGCYQKSIDGKACVRDVGVSYGAYDYHVYQHFLHVFAAIQQVCDGDEMREQWHAEMETVFAHAWCA